MIDQCIEAGTVFGVVLIAQGDEGSEVAIPHSVGCTAIVRDYERLDDGRLNILAEGRHRFRLIDYGQWGTPHLVGRIQPWADQLGDGEEVRRAAHSVEEMFQTYIAAIVELVNPPRKPRSTPRLPRHPRYLSYLVAASLQLELEEKQRLLEQPSVLDRLRHEVFILRRENELLRLMLEHARREEQGEQETIAGIFSLN